MKIGILFAPNSLQGSRLGHVCHVENVERNVVDVERKNQSIYNKVYFLRHIQEEICKQI